MKFNVEYFLFLTVICSAFILIIKLITPLMDKHCKRTWRYFAWILIGVRLLLPLDFSMENHHINLNSKSIQMQNDNLWPWQYSSVEHNGNTQKFSKYNLGKLNQNQKGQNLSNTSTNKENVQGQHENQNMEQNVSLQGKEGINNNEKINNENSNFNKYKKIYLSLSLYGKMLLVWITIAIIMVLYNLFAYMFIRRNMRKNSQVVEDEEVISQLRLIKSQLKINRNVIIRRNESLSSPMVMGWIHPTLYLTKDEYSREEYYYIFAHELTHVKKCHAFMKFIFVIINSIYWFNPFVYLMRRELTKDIEFLCDAGVSRILDIRDVKSYCEVILKCVTLKSQPQVLFSSSFGGIKKQVKERLVHIMDNNRKKNGVIMSAVLCTVLVGFTLVVSYKSNDNSVVSKKEDAIFLKDVNNVNDSKEEIDMLKGRVINVMNNSIIGDCKKSSNDSSNAFIKDIPFKDDFDFVTYESNWMEDGVNKPVKYAIGICKKEQSPLQGMFCKYDFMPIEKEGAAKNTILWKYENNVNKDVYELKDVDRCTTLGDGKMVIILRCYQDQNIYFPFERLNYGTTQISYLEDTIKRNVKVIPPADKDYVQVSKMDVTNGLFGSSEYIVLNQEEKKKILDEVGKNAPIAYKAADMSISHPVTFNINGKYYDCDHGFTGPYLMKLVKERCNFYDYNLDDLKNIKRVRLQKYYVNSLERYNLDTKNILYKEQIVDQEQQIKNIVEALKSQTPEAEKKAMCDEYNVSLLTLTRDDGMEIKLKLPVASSLYQTGDILMENGRYYNISKENIKKIYSCFENIVKRKPMKDITVDEKVVSSNDKFYLGMAAYDVEKYGFQINNDFDIESQPNSHDGGDIVYDYGEIKLIADGKDNYKSIYSIEVKDAAIPTKAGMTVGQNKANMEKLYGTDYKTEKVEDNNENMTKCVYRYDNNDFQVLLKNNVIKSWRIVTNK